MTKPSAFHDLPPEAFPFTLEFLRADTGEVVHRVEVTGPGALEVPALRKQYGVEIGIRWTNPNGSSSVWFQGEEEA